MILDRIIAAKCVEIQERKAALPAAELERQALSAAAPRDFAEALRRGQNDAIRLIAEFKRGSPSRGPIRLDLEPGDVARMYAAAGAAAISVLTDAPFFSGSLEDLRAVRAAVQIPLLRKEFILDRYQLLEARAAGADAILLIVAALSDPELRELQDHAAKLGLASLVEVHDEPELSRALSADAKIIGINNRDLGTFRVDSCTTLRLRPLAPPGIIVVSESGIRSRADAIRLQEAGVDAMLVGEFLMRHPDPGRAARELLGK